jgi:hypothetical protein
VGRVWRLAGPSLADAAPGDRSRAAHVIAARNATIVFALTRAECFLFHRLGARRRGIAAGTQSGDLQRRGLEEAETQLAGDAVALLATRAVTGGGRDGGVELTFATLAVEHGNILWVGGETGRGVE